MPAWSETDAAVYWDAADLYERANARLYVSADFALPRDLALDEEIELAHAFAQELTAAEQLPYTLAIHAGRDHEGREHNPHAHLMVSERRNDGISRDRDRWFKRADRAQPGRGGAPKTRAIHGRDWIEHARERWGFLTNQMLARHGRPERVDHRSYERQGLSAVPGRHFGPAAAFMVARGAHHERLEEAADVAAVEQRLADLEHELDAQLATRDATAPRRDDDEPSRHDEPATPATQTDDWTPGR